MLLYKWHGPSAVMKCGNIQTGLRLKAASNRNMILPVLIVFDRCAVRYIEENSFKDKKMPTPVSFYCNASLASAYLTRIP